MGSKVKVNEWLIFGVERLLGAANGDEPKRGIHGIRKQSREVKECARCKIAAFVALGI